MKGNFLFLLSLLLLWLLLLFLPACWAVGIDQESVVSAVWAAILNVNLIL